LRTEITNSPAAASVDPLASVAASTSFTLPSVHCAFIDSLRRRGGDVIGVQVQPARAVLDGGVDRRLEPVHP
jgi:hypothetical protein